MNANYQLTADDLLRAIRDASYTGLLRRMLRSIVIMIAAAIVGAIVMAALRGKLDLIPAIVGRVWLDLLLLFVVGIGVYTALNHWWFIPKGTTRLFQQMKSMQLPKELSVEERGLRFRDTYGDSLIPWDHIWKWRDTTAHLLIYLTDVHFFVVPKRAFAGLAEVEHLKSLLSKQVLPARL